MRSDNLYALPENLSAPEDDGACNHLLGMTVPAISLLSTAGNWIDLSTQTDRRIVVYCYPRTGKPDQELPTGWNDIPGARGCTPQSCAFRDHYQELQVLNTDVYGLSTQTTEYQKEAAERLHLPFPLLSDLDLQWATALRLPTFIVDGMTLIKRLTLIIENGVIRKVFYPVFPPDQNATQVVDWLKL